MHRQYNTLLICTYIVFLIKGENIEKKLLILTILIIAVFGIVIGEVVAASNAETTANEILNKNGNDSKILVVYFSRTGENYQVGNIAVGNTAMVASYIKEYLNADSFEIVPVEKYPDDYEQCKVKASDEKDAQARPAIQNKLITLMTMTQYL